MFLIRYFVTFLLLMSITLLPAQELLKRQDVGKVMEQILSKHLDKKQVSPEILKKSLSVYIDQFDPGRMYLLESEVQPFLNPNQVEMEQFLRQYQRNDFSKYEKLHGVIQKAIVRARNIREDLKDNLPRQTEAALYQQQSQKNFAKSVAELKERYNEQFVLYLNSEKEILGEKKLHDPKKSYERFDKFLSMAEDEYLYADPEGNPMKPSEKENMLVIHVLKSLATSLDSHTNFMSNSEAFDMRVRLEKGFHGIGVVLEDHDGTKRIARLIKDGPAEKSGKLKVHDEILSIDGERVDHETLHELVQRLRDRTASSVTLLVKRSAEGSGQSDKEIHVTLNRELVALDEGRVDVETEKVSDGIIGKLTLHSFYQGSMGITSEKDLRKAIRELQSQGKLRGLVLDLRSNSGGFLNQAVKVAGLFISNGVVVISRYTDGNEHFYRDMDGKVTFDGPIVVLTSKATASAAEIVAQALQDYGVAVVVGDEQTYGKGTIQSQTFTDDDSSSFFKVTVGKYYTVSGKTPQKDGVKADIVVPSILAHFDIGEEFVESSIGPDTISAAFQDSLKDIDPGIRPWFLHFYMPTLQERETGWKKALPLLKKNSAERMSRNGKYLEFINGGEESLINDEAMRKELSEMQMAEAVNILKDMIQVESQSNQ